MSILGTQIKQPIDRLDYDLDFTDWMAKNDRIVTVRIDIDNIGLVCPFHYIGNQIVKVWLDGGLNGETYKVTATVETSDGRVKQVEFKVKIKET